MKMRSTRPTPWDVWCYQMLNPGYSSGIHPVFEPLYKRRIKNSPMKGRITLERIKVFSPGLRVMVDYFDYYKVQHIRKINGLCVSVYNAKNASRPEYDVPTVIKALSTPIVEFTNQKGEKDKLPLHPEDWEWALDNMHQEVEFYGQEARVPLHNGKKECKTIATAKIIHAKDLPTPGIPYISGEDVGALLHGIHRHIETEPMSSEIMYSEKDLLPVLEALGLPKPVWGKSLKLDEWKRQRNKS